MERYRLALRLSRSSTASSTHHRSCRSFVQQSDDTKGNSMDSIFFFATRDISYAEVGENRPCDHKEHSRVVGKNLIGREVSPAGRDNEERNQRIERLCCFIEISHLSGLVSVGSKSNNFKVIRFNEKENFEISFPSNPLHKFHPSTLRLASQNHHPKCNQLVPLTCKYSKR